MPSTAPTIQARTGPRLALCSLALLATSIPARAQDKPAPVRKPAAESSAKKAGRTETELWKELNRILDRIGQAVRSRITPEQVESRLRERSASYRQFKAAVPSSRAASRPVSSDSAPRNRLLGDNEKQGLPDDTVMVVEGLPVLHAELLDLAKYLASYKPGTIEDNLPEAVQELITLRTVQASFKQQSGALEARVEGIRKRIENGEDFGELAKELSDGPSKEKQGDLGVFGRETMMKTFSRWAFTLELGRVSPVFGTPFGYHILKVTGKNKGKEPAQDQVRVSHILAMFSQDRASVATLIKKAEDGKSDVALVNVEWRKKLPAVYK